MSVEIEENATRPRTGSAPSRGTSRSSSSGPARARSATPSRLSTFPRWSRSARPLRREIEGETEISEVEVARHFTRLSRLNFSIDEALYPLGSCTMKHNPRVNEEVARLPGFAAAHPLAPEEVSQGALELAWRLERILAELTGLERVTLQPAAGAQGELAGILMVRARWRTPATRGRPSSSRTRRTAPIRPRRTSPDTRCGN